MADYQNLISDIRDGILTLTINRPDKLNALNAATVIEIKTAIEEAYDDKSVKGIIFTGAGNKAFVAGADIKEIAELNEVYGRKFAERGQETFFAIENCPKPVIAAVNGFALGGGCELAMACHLRVATEHAKFGLPEVNLGIIPGYGGTQRLTQLVGKGKALELIITGEMITAARAEQLGLVNHVVQDGAELIPKCMDLLKKITSKAPLAVSMAINCVNAAFDAEQKGYQTEANSFSNCCKSEDFREGTSAFLEKRAPTFKGE